MIDWNMTSPAINAMVKKIMPARLKPEGSLLCWIEKNTRPKISPMKISAGHICSKTVINGKCEIIVDSVVRFPDAAGQLIPTEAVTEALK